MAYRFKRSERVSDGVRRIALEQVERALNDINQPEGNSDTVAHQLRKRFKKLRGLLRLIREAIPDLYHSENAWFRDQARELSKLRDAEAFVEAVERLKPNCQTQSDHDALNHRLEQLREQRDDIANDVVDLEQTLGTLSRDLSDTRKRIQNWNLKKVTQKNVWRGFAKTYERGKTDLTICLKSPTAEHFHEWRKRVKYHWYHIRLLSGAWPRVVKSRAKELKRLGDLLGDDHDLSVLRGWFKQTDDAKAGKRLISERQKNLQQEALSLGERIYAESPEVITERFQRYFKIWRK